MDRIDFRKLHKDAYTAGKRIKEVEIPKGVFLCVEGRGGPDGDAYLEAIQILFSLAYTLQFALKLSGELDFAVAPLETIWDVEDPQHTPRREWRWRVVSRIPEAITAKELKRGQKIVLSRKEFDTSKAKRVTLRASRCLQVMHLGPYEKLDETYQRLESFAGDQGYRAKDPVTEIYLSDPQRVAPEKLKTIVRLPVAKRRKTKAAKGD